MGVFPDFSITQAVPVPRNSKQRPMLRGWPVLDRDADLPMLILKVDWDDIPGAIPIPLVFKLIWGPKHAFSHLWSEHLAGVHDKLVVLCPEAAQEWTRQIRQQVPKWKPPTVLGGDAMEVRLLDVA